VGDVDVEEGGKHNPTNGKDRCHFGLNKDEYDHSMKYEQHTIYIARQQTRGLPIL
jgi:hypothetical protein